MKIKPFRSKRGDTDVHHNNNRCTVGNNIEKENKVSGTGGRRLCKRCKDRNVRGK